MPKSNLILLKHLFLVEKVLVDPKTPDSDDKVLYILQSLLVNIIVSQLTDIREHFQLESIISESYSGATQSLIADSLTNSTDLLSWSILYYLYVQPDLGFTVDSIGEVIGVTARTIRRYRKRGVELLTQLLWQKEDQARHDFHQKTLYQKLGFNSQSYFGHDQDVEKIVNILKHNKNQVIYVYGAKGIGKTSFIRTCIYKLIREINCDDILWLDNVSDSVSVKTYLQTYYSLTDTNISLSSFVSLFDCIFVFDSADELCKSDEINQLIHQLGGATIFISSDLYCVSSSIQHHVRWLPLENDHLERIINSHLYLDEADKKQMIAESEGNPGRLHEIIKYHQLSENIISSSDNFLNALDLNQRLALAFIPKQNGILFEDFYRVCQIIGLNKPDMRFLFTLNILYENNQRVHCSIEPDYISGSIKDLSSIIKDFTDIFSKLRERATIIRHMLNYDVSFDVKSALVKQYWRDGIEFGDKLGWHSLLMTLRLVVDEAWLTLALGVSHKHINHLQQAESTLMRAIEISGINGEFHLQTEAMLELTKVYRITGRYKNATDYLDKLNMLWDKYLPSRLLNNFLLEKAQLALDKNEVNYALGLANSLQTYEAQILRAECFYRLGDYLECLKVCHDVLTHVQLPDVVIGIIHNLIGRCHQSTNIELSAEQYSLAIEYFSQSFSLMHLSRAQINLATTFIGMEELDRAHEYFNQAEEICSKVNDVIGLKTIEKNRAYIHRLIVSRYK